MIDFEIPKRYGLRQTIGDTLGIGGIMRALRTIPVMLDMCREMEQVCPDVALPQLHQPDGDALSGHEPGDLDSHRRALPQRAGHGRGDRGLARRARTTRSTTSAPASTTWPSTCASSATAKISTRPCGRSRPKAAYPAWERVRFEVLRRFGYFVTESSEHFSEYVPWFIKPDRDDLITATTCRSTSTRLAARTRSPTGRLCAPR